MSNLVKTKTLVPVKHDGKYYSIGAEIELTLQQYISLQVIKAVEQANTNETNLHNDNKSDGAGVKPPAPVAPETAEYAEKTNADQLAYLQTLGDEDFKAQAQDLLPVSKSKSKTYIERRLKGLTEVVE